MYTFHQVLRTIAIMEKKKQTLNFKPEYYSFLCSLTCTISQLGSQFPRVETEH